MKPSDNANTMLAITRSKAKMYEYNVPIEDHIRLPYPTYITRLLDLTIGILGDLSADYEKIEMDGEVNNLLFSAKYFDALFNSKQITSNDDYIKLLGACAYYLIGYPGSAKVLVNLVEDRELNANALEQVILALLKKSKINGNNLNSDNPYKDLISAFNEYLDDFSNNGTSSHLLKSTCQKIKEGTHAYGSDRELLFGDIIYAISSKYIKISAWESLPKYSGISPDLWRPYIKRKTSIKELWPAQVMLGEGGVFKGKSAIIQMPTSVGKTKATELIIRGSILSKRSNFAVIIAPFRALCQEIYNSMSIQFSQDIDIHLNLVSDVLQVDTDDIDYRSNHILILTPEKFEYLLRHKPEMGNAIGLIIYDEGHLFDDKSRGVKYELLLSSLKQKLPEKAQVILISAVMPNTREIGEWLIGKDCTLIEARSLTPTNKSLAFASWDLRRGRLNFVNESNIEVDEFFVPGILEQQKLKLWGREWKEKLFPAKKNNIFDSYHIALSLGCRLVQSGPVAIFTGRKDSALVIARDIVDAFDRGLDYQKPSNVSDTTELERLSKYLKNTLGNESIQAKAAAIGIFIHHGSTPHGVRLSVEYALQKEHVKFVICTSTLAQGVNLPIRYLIVTTNFQGVNRIKTRDFHNLMGRAGRAGIYTEGTIIFSNHSIYDNKGWRWNETKQLLDPDRSEKCKSHILTLFDAKPEDEDLVPDWEQNRKNILSEINSFLLDAFSDLSDIDEIKTSVKKLVENTLAYYQADDSEKEELINIFLEIAEEIISKEPSANKRKIFAKSILNLDDSKSILVYIEDKVDELANSTDPIDALKLLWPVIYKYSTNIPRSITEDLLLQACILWISGNGFPGILNSLSGEKFGKRDATIDHIVDLCENSYGFEGSLIVGTCIELLALIDSRVLVNSDLLLSLQKMLKYGLSEDFQIKLYEMGLSDRNLVIDIASMVKSEKIVYSEEEILLALRNEKERIRTHIKANFPAYFEWKFDEIV
jgi:POLQ-like helicase